MEEKGKESSKEKESEKESAKKKQLPVLSIILLICLIGVLIGLIVFMALMVRSKSRMAVPESASEDVSKFLLAAPEELSEEEEESGFYGVAIRELPGGLTDFMEKLRWIGFYDCESEESVINSCSMIFEPGLCFDLTLFTKYLPAPHYGTIIFDEHEVGYYAYDPEGMDWILMNVFNADEAFLGRIKDLYLDESGEYRWYENSVYAPPVNITITNAETDGTLYQVEVKETPADSANLQFEEIYYAVLEYKTDGDFGYWSVYKISHEPVYTEKR